MLAYSEGEEVISPQISVFDFLKSSSDTRALPPVLLDIVDDKQMTRPQFKRKCLLKFSSVFQISYFL